MKSKPLAAAALAAFALVAGVAAAETPLPLGTGEPQLPFGTDGPPLRDLQAVYLECDRITSRGRADTDTMTRCSQVGEELLWRGFGGDFDGMLAWWQAARVRDGAVAQIEEGPLP